MVNEKLQHLIVCRLRLDKDTLVASDLDTHTRTHKYILPLTHTHTTLIRYSGNYIPHVPFSVILHLGNPSKIPLSFRVFYFFSTYFLFYLHFSCCFFCVPLRAVYQLTLRSNCHTKVKQSRKKFRKKKKEKMKRRDEARFVGGGSRHRKVGKATSCDGDDERGTHTGTGTGTLAHTHTRTHSCTSKHHPHHSSALWPFFLVCLFCVEIFFPSLRFDFFFCCCCCLPASLDDSGLLRLLRVAYSWYFLSTLQLGPLSLWLLPAQSTMGMPKCLVLPF